MTLSPPAQLGLVIGALVAVAAILIVDDARQEFRRRELDQAAAARRAQGELPEPWPTPLPLPRARWTEEGFAYEAVAPEFDPCGAGPMQASSDEKGQCA